MYMNFYTRVMVKNAILRLGTHTGKGFFIPFYRFSFVCDAIKVGNLIIAPHIQKGHLTLVCQKN